MKRKEFLARLKQSPLVCDGAMGTMLYSKGILLNRCYDELNLSNPSLVQQVHREYFSFGVDIIECPRCGGRLRVVEVVSEPADVARVLHGRVARAPPPELFGQLVFDFAA